MSPAQNSTMDSRYVGRAAISGWSQERDDLIVRLLTEGQTHGEIGRSEGASRTRVTQIIARLRMRRVIPASMRGCA